MKTTQCDRIIRHLNDYGTITAMEAMQDYGIMRLASRISDLKKKGYQISSETQTGKNRCNEITHYSIYKLVKEN